MNSGTPATSAMMLMDVAFATIMLATGFVAGWWIKRSLAGSAPSETEKAQQALDNLRELASSVAEGVGQHNTRVREINTDLTSAAASTGGLQDATVLASVAEIIKANELLQEQLATAEVKLQKQAQELETQTAVARTDALTGLYNRRAFDDEMNRRYAEWQRRNTIFSLLLMDIDHFKKFNDTHGHQAGDEILRGVAQVLQSTMREMDLVARYGGEEFAVVLPVTNLAESLRAAERARAAIAGSIFLIAGKELKVTVSIGTAQVFGTEGVALMVKRADDALYKSKGDGRNRVSCHDGEKIRAALEAAVEPAPKASPTPVAKPAPAAVRTQANGEAPNLATFYADLRRHVTECQRFQVPLSLLLVDIDNFKQLVSRLGAETGELVFRTISEFLDSSINPTDVASRFGQGQFAIMLPGTSLTAASKMAEQIRAAVASCALDAGGKPLKITLSLGLVEHLPADSATALIERAEAALNASRSAGFNCTHIHDGQQCAPLDLLVAAS